MTNVLKIFSSKVLTADLNTDMTAVTKFDKFKDKTPTEFASFKFCPIVHFIFTSPYSQIIDKVSFLNI